MKFWLHLFAIAILLATFQPVHALHTESADDTAAVFDLIASCSDRFPDAGMVTLFDRISTEYRETGAAATEEEVLMHFRDASESTEYRAIHYDYNPRTAKIEFLDARVYRAEGKVMEPIDMASVIIRKAPADSIFWNFDMVICPVPRLDDGDALYYRIKRQGLNLAYLHEVSESDFQFIPPQEGYFMDTLYFQEDHPIVEKTYDII
ncbi:DUF3857 domain-containing protein, partial [bacterium]|nr:DUF3857 domain-containing protein [candidate division CSSED10-310 bacterium]